MAASAPAGPKSLDMVRAAIEATADRKGASVPAIKSYILENYPNVDPTKLKFRLKKAIEKGFESGLLRRPKSSEATGPTLTGRFLLNKEHIAAAEKKAKKPKASADGDAAGSKARKAEAKTKPKAAAKTKAKASDKEVTKKSPATKAKDKAKQAKEKSAKGKSTPKSTKSPKQAAKGAKADKPKKSPKTKAAKK